MKRLWVILFVFINFCFSQFAKESFSIVKGENTFIIIPNKKIKINDNSVIYKSIDYNNKKIMVWDYNLIKGISENVKIDFNQIKSITFKDDYFYQALEGFVRGLILGGIAGYFLLKDEFDDNMWYEEKWWGVSVLRGGFIGGLVGMVIWLNTNFGHHLKIGDNDWQIK